MEDESPDYPYEDNQPFPIITDRSIIIKQSVKQKTVIDHFRERGPYRLASPDDSQKPADNCCMRGSSGLR